MGLITQEGRRPQLPYLPSNLHGPLGPQLLASALPQSPTCRTSGFFSLIVKALQARAASSFYFKQVSMHNSLQTETKTGEELSDGRLLVTAGAK